jgi:hypothetical protein
MDPAHPDAEKEPASESPGAARYRREDIGAFMARLRLAPELGWLIRGLIPDEGSGLWHGQPRDFKSLSAIAATVALASDRDAFDNPRFKHTPGVVVAYFTEEDSERLFYARLRWLTNRNDPPLPGRFFPYVRRALTFESDNDRDFILDELQKTRATLAVFDPLRSFTSLSDKGPADFAPVVRFLRQIQNETTCKAILIPHHDVKVLATTKDRNPERSRSQDASGGGIFSVSDCPVTFRKLAWNRAAAFPEDFKLSGDPKPFEIEFQTDTQYGESGEPRFGTWVHAVAETKDERDVGADVHRNKILAYLTERAAEDKPEEKKWATIREVEQAAKLTNGTGRNILEQLEAAKVVSCATGDAAKALGRNSRAILWRKRP